MTHALPDFASPPLAAAPLAAFAPAPRDGVLPEGFFSTTNLPTYVRLEAGWTLATRARMDAALVLRRTGEAVSVESVEARRVRAGDPVAIGELEDGREGIFVDARAFLADSSPSEFQFMGSAVSRERPVDYPGMARDLARERDGGTLVWVVGPALVHARARADLVWMIEHGYVHALMAGNAVAVHDIEAALYGTTLGMDARGVPRPGGHSLHMRAINRVRAAGSIEEAVRSGLVKDGLMHALVTRRVPYVLAGSIRDDGPLPGVVTDALSAQDAMRVHAERATGAVLVASALHSIAFGNMLPAFHTRRGAPEPLLTVAVDQTEFVVGKLKDRGTHQAYGVVTNAQDFLPVLRAHLPD
jgi:lysine-ketoglutarate reductase/saccharopine dehydrogenase-like protein (TIGR00300 family)